MVKYKYVLFFSERNQRYKLVKVKNDGYNPSNPKVIWVFNYDKLNIAKKIMTNLNMASEISSFQEPIMKVA